MGEAKRRKRRHEGLQERYPFCIYCGGNVPATEIDHMPPRVMFRLTQRPKGLEFPSCSEFNKGTSAADLVATYFARNYLPVQNEDDAKDRKRLAREVDRLVPGLRDEMHIPEELVDSYMGRRGFWRNLNMFYAAGPLAFAHMTAFGAKAALVLYIDRFGRAA